METDAARRPAHDADGADVAVVFRDDVRVDFDGESVSLTNSMTSFTLRPVRGGLMTAMSRLAGGPTLLPDLFEGLQPAEQVQFQRFLGRAGHLIARSVSIGERELLRIEHTARQVDYQVADVPADLPVRLSKFAFCRSLGDALVLESPLAKFRARLVHPAARRLVAELGSARTAAGLAADGLPVDDVRELLGHLTGAGFLDVGSPTGAFAADEDETLRQWDFHDLLMHSRVRSGRYDDALGAVYPYVGTIEPRPAVKPPPDGPAVELSRPEFDELLERDPSLTAAIEGRRSIRQYGEQPLTLAQLGEFLYRVARVRAHFVPGEAGGDEVVSRPYPSGGGSYELELYLTVRRCDGLEPGIYYYDPVAHRLVLVNEDATDRDQMFAVASMATGLTAKPDVVITMTSRFQRLSWKYRAIAYATSLRHTGVLYQTMYLVATAMGLAPCGLGNGDADLAGRAFGLDYLRESSLGDFILGTRAPDESIAGDPEAGWNMVNSPDWMLKAAPHLP